MINSTELAQFIEATEGISKPWLLLQLRLQKLRERRSEMDPGEYTAALEELQQDLMRMGEWWVGQEPEVFGER
jgi:hypothetical protein